MASFSKRTENETKNEKSESRARKILKVIYAFLGNVALDFCKVFAFLLFLDFCQAGTSFLTRYPFHP